MMETRRDKFETWDSMTLLGRRWFFHYRANNGEIVIPSQSYRSAAGRDKGIAAVRKCHDAIVKAKK